MKKPTARQLLFLTIIVSFATVLIYELLTPLMADDLIYLKVVEEAEGIPDLFRQEYDHYMGHSGRNVAHIVMRLLMYTHSHVLQAVFLSVVFVVMTFFAALLASDPGTQETGGKQITAGGYTLVVLLIWVFGVRFDETVLWLTGACNYMVTMTIMLGDLLVYRRIVRKALFGGHEGRTGCQGAGICIAAVVLGLLAGWCNENTSGAVILYALFLMWKCRKEEHGIPKALALGTLANLAGFLLMLSSPGNAYRSAAEEVNANPLIQLSARVFSVTHSVYALFFPLLVCIVLTGILLHHQGTRLPETEGFILYLVLFAATSYALLLVPQSQDRTFFGAGIFLIIALMRGVRLLRRPVILTAATGVLLLYMAFSYVENGAKLAWIYREETERMDYLQVQRDAGAEECGAPMLRPQFTSPYSAAYDMDIAEDWQDWVNGAYAYYYDLHLVWGVPREDWSEY